MSELSAIRIELKELCKSFNKGSVTIDVLRGINMVIEQGDSISVVGASGVGKSTLLHILGTLDRPSAGAVCFNGQDVFDRSEAELAALRNTTIGFAFQFHHLLPEFTALENVMIPPIIAGSDLQSARLKAERALGSVGMEHRLEHQPGELSGGEQQRVSIARALVMEPKVLLADEPSGNLDHRTGAGIHDLLIDLNRRLGVTLVVVTHNMDLARQLSRQYRMEEGRLVGQGSQSFILGEGV